LIFLFCCAKHIPADIVFIHRPIFRVFAPQGRHIAPTKVKFGREERTVGPLLLVKFHLDRLMGVSFRPSKLWKFRILPILLPLRGGSLARFLQNLQGLCASSVYMHKYASSWFILTNDKTIKQLTRWGIFSHIFDDPKRLNYWWDLKKIARWNDDTNHLYHHAKFGGNRSTHLGVRVQSVMFFTLYVCMFWFFFDTCMLLLCTSSAYIPMLAVVVTNIINV